MDDNTDVTDLGDFKTTDKPIQSIKVVGVGGGGNNAVEKMFAAGINGVSFVQINTDKQVLQDSKVPTVVLLGAGLGAGGKPEVARKLAEEDADKIAEIFEDGTDMVFVTAGMGGGTGTGAAPVVARIAREKGILTIGIVTIPFSFEGPGRNKKALAGANEMAKYVDALLVLDNDRLVEIYPNFSIMNAFRRADDTLRNAAEGITEIITRVGIVNRDFNDVDATLRDGKTAIISSGYGEGPDRINDAIQEALRSPLLKDCNVVDSKRMLFVLYASCGNDDEAEGKDSGENSLRAGETKAITNFVASMTAKDIEVKWGLYNVPDLGDRIKVTILASGFETTSAPKREERTQSGGMDSNSTNNATNSTIGTLGEDKAIALALAGYNILSPDEYDKDESISRFISESPRAGYAGIIGKGNSAKTGTGATARRDNTQPTKTNVISFDDM